MKKVPSVEWPPPYASTSTVPSTPVLIEQKTTTFHILMTNDVYDMLPDHEGLGGLAEVSTLIKEEKKKLKPSNTIVTLNGDFLSASLLALKYKGSHMVDIFNHMPLDYVVLGNHEFDFGADVLRTRIKEGKNFEWFASNVRDRDTKDIMTGCIRKKIFDVDGIRIGMFGVCTEETKLLSRPGDSVIFEPAIFSARKLVRELRNEDGCDVIIAMTHLSIGDDRKLAKSVEGINVIIGGHDHTPHTQIQGDTLIHKAGHDAFYLTRIDLLIEKRCNKVKDNIFNKVKVYPSWNMILNRNTIPDVEVKKVVDKYASELPRDAKDVIGMTLSRLNSCTDSIRSKETTMANLVTDIIFDRFSEEADIVILNGGSIRGDKGYDEGQKLTRGDLYREFPFKTLLYLAEIDGESLLKVVEQALSRAEFKPGCFPHFQKGVQVVFDVEKKPLRRVKTFTIQGKPVEPKMKYRIITTDYLLGSGDGLTGFEYARKIEHESNGSEIRNSVLEYILREGVVETAKEGRIFSYVEIKMKDFAETMLLLGST